jgi:hypothetical protein
MSGDIIKYHGFEIWVFRYQDGGWNAETRPEWSVVWDDAYAEAATEQEALALAKETIDRELERERELSN